VRIGPPIARFGGFGAESVDPFVAEAVASFEVDSDK
jgi:hypothetical protein